MFNNIFINGCKSSPVDLLLNEISAWCIRCKKSFFDDSKLTLPAAGATKIPFLHLKKMQQP